MHDDSKGGHLHDQVSAKRPTKGRKRQTPREALAAILDPRDVPANYTKHVNAEDRIATLLLLQFAGAFTSRPSVVRRLDEITAMHDTAEAERRLIAACEHLDITGDGIDAAADRAMAVWLVRHGGRHET